MIHDPILIIGGGTMGSALATAWRKAMHHTPIHVVEPDAARRAQWEKLGANSFASLAQVDITMSIVVLAVKPQQFPELVEAYKANPHLTRALLISIMAGVTLEQLAMLSPERARVMPNTALAIGESMSVICAPQLVEEKLDIVKELFGHAGHVLVVGQENQMHAVTAISGSGPAYLFAFMEGLEKAAMHHGLDVDTARTLVLQTVRGAALLADHSGGDVTRLREAVTSPGGTTQAALKKLEGLDALLDAAVDAAAARSKELAG